MCWNPAFSPSTTHLAPSISYPSNLLALPLIVGVRLDLHFLSCEVTVGVEVERAAGPDAHGVHVVPVLPVGGEPPEPEASLRYD